ncbi:MAG: hypothetical protein ACKOET_19125 [Verrucomicrobiota bacterium]
MKDGTTPPASKAEPGVDLESEAMSAATVTGADRGDSRRGPETLVVAQANPIACGTGTSAEEPAGANRC